MGGRSSGCEDCVCYFVNGVLYEEISMEQRQQFISERPRLAYCVPTKEGFIQIQVSSKCMLCHNNQVL